MSMTSTPHLLDVPHHDGSEQYAPQGVPALGDVVPVRLRVPASTPEDAVWVRTVKDAEPHMVQARLDRTEAGERWYVADVPVHNPVTSYRWLLDQPGGYRWLTGRGCVDRDVTDAGDFRLTVHPGTGSPDPARRPPTARTCRTGRCPPPGRTSRWAAARSRRCSSTAATCPASSSAWTTSSASASTRCT
jgi:hypothetical protein